MKQDEFAAPKRFRLRRRKIRPVQQMEAAECGVACLAMVLDYYGSSIPLEELREQCGTSRDGNSALQLVEAAQRLGLRARGLRLNLSQLERFERPLILHWQFSHFVVLEGYKRGRALLVDPASGRVQAEREQMDRCFSGIALDFAPTAKLVRRARKSLGVSQYFANLRRRLAAVAFIMVAGASTQLLGVVSPAVNQVLIDEVIRMQRTTWLLPVVGVLVGATLAGFVLRWLYQIAMAHLQSALSVRLSNDIGRRLLRLPLEFIESRSRGDLIQRVGAYAGLGNLLTSTATGLFDVLFALSLASLMLAYDTRLALLTLGIDLARVLVVRFLREDARERAAGELSARAREAAVLLQATASAEVVKAFGLEQKLEEWYKKRLVERLSWSMKSERLSAGAGAVLSLFDGAASAVVLWVGGLRVIELEITLGVLAGFLAIRGVLAAPLASILGTVEGWLEFKSVLARTDELLAHAVAPRGTRSYTAEQPRLELENVGFRYSSGSPWVLRNVSLVVEPGQHVALVGPSGQGKSTLLKLMAGVLSPTEGRVLLNGVELGELDPATLAARVGAVIGDPLVLEGTIRENVVIRAPDASDDDVRAAADAACFTEVVQRSEAGYETRLDAQGTNLSGGERQRLALTQALIGQPRLLFLDEATCFLDPATEARVIQSTLCAGITVVSVAHRPAVIEASAQVFEVQGGKVTPRPELGRHGRGLYLVPKPSAASAA